MNTDRETNRTTKIAIKSVDRVRIPDVVPSSVQNIQATTMQMLCICNWLTFKHFLILYNTRRWLIRLTSRAFLGIFMTPSLHVHFDYQLFLTHTHTLFFFNCRLYCYCALKFTWQIRPEIQTEERKKFISKFKFNFTE